MVGSRGGGHCLEKGRGEKGFWIRFLFFLNIVFKEGDRYYTETELHGKGLRGKKAFFAFV